MHNPPLVSVAMCTYNGARFIREQLDSILNQTHSHLELVVCDDGSSDETVAIIESYCENHDNIRLYVNTENLGLIKNFEKAISLCRGDYIALADHDDIWLEDKLESFLSAIGDNVLIYSDAWLIDADSNRLGQKLVQPAHNLIRGHCNKAFLLENCVSGNTLMFKNELLPHILPIPEKISFHDVWIAFVASTYGTITYTEEPKTLYRRYAGQVTNVTKKRSKNILERIRKKRERRLKSAMQSEDNMDAFLSLDILDQDTKNLILMLKKHYHDYRHIFYNMELAGRLMKEKDVVFAVKPLPKRAKRALKVPMGYRFYSTFLFVI